MGLTAWTQSQRRVPCSFLLQFFGASVNVTSRMNISCMPFFQLVFYLENKGALEMEWFSPGVLSGGWGVRKELGA